MKIELEDKDVDRIATAIAAKMGNAKPADKPAKGKAKPAEAEDAAPEGDVDGGDADTGDEFEGGDAAPEVSRDDVRAALSALSKAFNQDEAMKILKDVGKTTALSKLDESKFADVIAAANKKVKSKK